MLTGPNKFDINSKQEFYKLLNLEENSFHFTKVSEKTITYFLKELKTNKATGIENLSGLFLTDLSKFLVTPKHKYAISASNPLRKNPFQNPLKSDP